MPFDFMKSPDVPLMEAIIRHLPRISSEQAINALNPIADDIRDAYSRLEDGAKNVHIPYPQGILDLERFEEAFKDVAAMRFQTPFEVTDRSREGFTIGIAA